MSASTALGKVYQRFRWPAQSLPFSFFSLQERCLCLRILTFGGSAPLTTSGPEGSAGAVTAVAAATGCAAAVAFGAASFGAVSAMASFQFSRRFLRGLQV